MAVTSRCSLTGISIFADDLDRIGEHDFALVDGDSLGRERFGNVARSDRAEELVVLTGLARSSSETPARSPASFCAASFSVASFFANAARIFSSRFMLPGVASSAELARQKKIARVALGHFHQLRRAFRAFRRLPAE